MNISLNQNYPTSRDGDPETLQARLDEHQAVMELAGYPISGKPVLVPEPNEAYTGSYQVGPLYTTRTPA